MELCFHDGKATIVECGRSKVEEKRRINILEKIRGFQKGIPTGGSFPHNDKNTTR